MISISVDHLIDLESGLLISKGCKILVKFETFIPSIFNKEQSVIRRINGNVSREREKCCLNFKDPKK